MHTISHHKLLDEGMTMSKIYEVAERFLETSHINAHEYKKFYEESINNPDLFWAKQAE